MPARRAILAGGGLLALLSACGSDPAPSGDGSPAGVADAAAAALPAGWIGGVVAAPDRFAAVVEGADREAWVALHGGDLHAATEAADAVLRARAWEERAQLHTDLAHLSSWTWQTLADDWIAQDPALGEGPLPLLAALAVADAGQADAARRRASAFPPPRQQLVEALLVPVVRDGGAPPPPPGGVAGATIDGKGCIAAHLDLRSGRIDRLPAPCDAGAALSLPGERSFQDPLIQGALAFQARTAARAARGGGTVTEQLSEGAPLPHLLFGPWWSIDDLRAALAGDLSLSAPGPSLAVLDLPEVGAQDDPQAALERARDLDAALDAWAAGQRDSASEEGRALLDHLRLVEQLRARTLVRWSRQALRQDRPRQALAWLQLAHDADDSRAVGPVNRPSLFALLAEARARTGRSREALDALAPVVAAYPQTRGLAETLGDLVVLQNMGRQGDSKEL